MLGGLWLFICYATIYNLRYDLQSTLHLQSTLRCVIFVLQDCNTLELQCPSACFVDYFNYLHAAFGSGCVYPVVEAVVEQRYLYTVYDYLCTYCH